MSYDLERSVGDRFEEQVRLRGDALAIQERDRRYTYAQLNAAANGVAHALHARHPRVEEVVAVLVPDGAAMIVALLGVWKAGKIAIPIDPALAKPRLQQMLDESGAEVIVVDSAASAVVDLCRDSGLPMVDVETAVAAGPVENLGLRVAARSLALVVFTSGSSGTPRGVSIEHRVLVYRSLETANVLQSVPGDRQLLMNSCRHVAGALATVRSLIMGGSLFVYDLKADGVNRIAAALTEHAITIFITIVTIARQVIGAAGTNDHFPHLRVVALAGEPVLYRDLIAFAPHVPRSCRFLNLLASTEAPLYGVYATDPTRLAADGQVPTGGEAIPVEMRLLDDEGREVAANEVGEMVVRSRYLARGYWRRPDLTAAVFVPDAHDPEMRTLRTGDLGLRRGDGSVLYMGRKDAQVKIRGYRIEPVEVEMALLDHPDVKACAVVASERAVGDRRLVGYLLPQDGVSVDIRSVRAHARARLPHYMVPSAFAVVSSLGKTHSGKIDRRSLPPFDWSAYEGQHKGAEPRTGTERTLLGIWREVLATDAIGIHDEFLDVGGDSLLAIRLFSRVEEVLGRKLQLGVLFNAATVARQAELIDQPESATPTVVAIQPNGTRPPFFCVPGLDGEVMVFTELARRMGSDQPFYALYPRFVEDTSDRAVSVETVAAHYADAMCVTQPSGPYYLGGYSSGGIVALEVAHVLRTRGHEVAFVALLDTIAINGVSTTSQPNAAIQSLRDFVNHFGFTADQRVRVVRAAQAIRRHFPKPYAGRVDVFRASEADSLVDTDWEGLSPSLHLHDVPGNHFTMIHAPHAVHLANRLRQVMDSVSATPLEAAR